LDFEDLGKRFAVFFKTGLLALTFRARRDLRATAFFAELFFFLGFAIARRRFFTYTRRENGRLIKNIWASAQADSVKKINRCLSARSCCYESPSGALRKLDVAARQIQLMNWRWNNASEQNPRKCGTAKR